jgi:hypothetical protein
MCSDEMGIALVNLRTVRGDVNDEWWTNPTYKSWSDAMPIECDWFGAKLNKLWRSVQ